MEKLTDSHGVQSLEIGVTVLRALLEGGRALMLKDVAARTGMPPSKVHRYLVSLVRSGLVEQDLETSRYDLGPLALHVGLAAVDRLDRVKLGLDSVERLRDATHETTALAVWGEHGPVVVRWERPHRPIMVNVLTGSTLSMLGTACGRVFSAWMPSDTVDHLIEKELVLKRDPEIRSRKQLDQTLAHIRSAGYAFVRNSEYANGVLGLAAPVFNFRNQITMAVVIVGVEGISDMSDQSLAVRELKRTAHALSRRLGAFVNDTK